jgi:ATP-binding cassette subfamily A (ABC1) protein 3
MDCGGQQLSACLSRIVTEKRRNIRGTCCEYLSHFIILSILVLGYLQAQVFYYPEKDYSAIDIKIDDQLTAISLYDSIISGPIITPSFNEYLILGRVISAITVGYQSLVTQTSYGRSFTNLLFPGSIHFAPNNAATQNLINYMNHTYSMFSTLDVYVHDSEDHGIDFILHNLDNPALALIVLRDTNLQKMNYVIRQNYTTIPNTNLIVLDPAVGLQTYYQQYLLSGFLSLQQAVDNWAMRYTGLTSLKEESVCSNDVPTPFFVPYPTFSYNQNLFYSAVGFLLGLAMVMSTMYPMSKLTKSIVEEKETKIREVMKIMGLSDTIYSLSWFFSAFVLFFWIAITTTLLTTGSFLISSNSFLIFLYFFFYCMSIINFSFLVSVFFSNAKLAAIIAPVILFSTLLPRYLFYTTNGNEEVSNKILASFLAPTAFSFGADIISTYEYGGVGIQYNNIWKGDFNFGIVLLMLWLDFYVYGALAWYLDKIIPHEMGTHRHPLFIFDPHYWLSCCGLGKERNNDSTGFNDLLEFNEEYCRNNNSLEFIPPDQQALAKIRIKGLGKRYSDGKVAVRNFSLAMLEGQITCLLGHNGAGKCADFFSLFSLLLSDLLSLCHFFFSRKNNNYFYFNRFG